MDRTEILTLIVAAITLAASVITIWRTLRRRRLSLASGKDPLRPHRFTKRRVTMGILLALVSVSLFAGVFLLEDLFRLNLAWIGWYWVAVLGLLLWLLGLALFDMVQVMFSYYEIHGRYRSSGKKKR